MVRNGEIELWRFIVALIIVDFHFRGDSVFLYGYLFHYGRVGVEFFFILSGYLLAAGAIKRSIGSPAATWHEIHQETFSLIKRRICSFLPETWVACAIACCVYGLLIHPSCRLFFQQIVVTMFGNACFLSMSGLFRFHQGLNGPTWYLSTLLMGTCILYPLIRRWRVSPMMLVCGILLLGSIYINGQAVDCAGVVETCGIYKGNFRGIAEMLIGASLYPFIQTLKHATISGRGRITLTLMKWGMSLCLLGYACNANLVGHNVGFAIVMICGILILSFSEQCFDKTWYRHPFLYALGRFSLPLFLSHAFYARFMLSCLPDGLPELCRYAVYGTCALVTAFVVMYSARLLRGAFSTCGRPE